jgi:hypothetical protein
MARRSAMTHPFGAQHGYRPTPLSAEERARGEANFAPLVAQMLVARGRFRVSADTPDQVELFQGVARRVSDMLQRPVVSYANGREIVITFGQQEAPTLVLRRFIRPGYAVRRSALTWRNARCCRGWPPRLPAS